MLDNVNIFQQQAFKMLYFPSSADIAFRGLMVSYLENKFRNAHEEKAVLNVVWEMFSASPKAGVIDTDRYFQKVQIFSQDPSHIAFEDHPRLHQTFFILYDLFLSALNEDLPDLKEALDYEISRVKRQRQRFNDIIIEFGNTDFKPEDLIRQFFKSLTFKKEICPDEAYQELFPDYNRDCESLTGNSWKILGEGVSFKALFYTYSRLNAGHKTSMQSKDGKVHLFAEYRALGIYQAYLSVLSFIRSNLDRIDDIEFVRKMYSEQTNISVLEIYDNLRKALNT